MMMAPISTTKTTVCRQPPRASLPHSGWGSALTQSPTLARSGKYGLSRDVVPGSSGDGGVGSVALPPRGASAAITGSDVVATHPDTASAASRREITRASLRLDP